MGENIVHVVRDVGAETYIRDEGATVKNIRCILRLETNAAPAEPLVVEVHSPADAESHGDSLSRVSRAIHSIHVHTKRLHARTHARRDRHAGTRRLSPSPRAPHLCTPVRIPTHI